MSDNLKFRMYLDSDFEGYKNLYKSVYHKDIDETFVKWKNQISIDENSNSLIYLVLNENDEIIGANSFFIIKVKYNNEFILAVQSGDTMVSSAYRGCGLFKKLLHFAIDDLKTKGYSFIFGYANNNSHPGFVRLGFETLYKINLYVKILNFNSMLKSKLGSKWYVNFVGKLIDRAINLFSIKRNALSIEEINISSLEVAKFISTLENKFAHFIKDEKYLNWKYKSKPNCTYKSIAIRENNEIKAIFVLRHDIIDNIHSAKIMECLTSDFDSVSNFYKLLARYYKNSNFDYIETWETGSKTMLSIYKKNLFLKRNIELYLIIKILDEKFNYLVDLNLWNVFNGDTDTA